MVPVRSTHGREGRWNLHIMSRMTGRKRNNMKSIKHIKSAVLFVMISLMISSYTYGDSPIEENNDDYVYSVTKISGDIDWSSVPVIQIDKVLWTEDYGIRGQGQLCYDNDYLYVHQSAVEQNIRAVNTEPLSPVYEDSCLEFFFMLDGSPNYFNFEINPNGCLCIQFGPEKTDRINIVRDDSTEYFDIHADKTPDGWEVYYRIPLDFIRFFYPDAGFRGSFSANMYKCGNKTMNKHFLSWRDIKLDKPNFHCPEYFGKIVFE